MKAFNCDLPETMLEEIKSLGVGNKTEYISQLIIADFEKRGVKKKTLTAINEALNKEKK